MFPSNNYKRARTPKYRPINPADTVATTGNLVNPVGSLTPVFTDPSSASYGPQGLFGSGLPTVNPGASGNLPGYYGPAGKSVQQRFYNSSGFIEYGNPFEAKQYKPPTVFSSAITSASNMVGKRFGVDSAGDQYAKQTNPNAPKPGTLTTGSFNPQQVLDSIQQRLENGSTEPINAADADALGLTQVLNDPNSGWSKNENGQYVNLNAPGTTLSQEQKNQIASNRRAEKTAEGLMYDKNYGWIPRVQWQRLRKRKAARRALMASQAKKTTAAAEPTQTSEGFVGSFGVVSFNTDAG